MQNDLIFDVGMHLGEDTDFYLKKGFRVVGVEANPALSDRCAQRFRADINDGRLVIVNKAIAREPGKVTFYQNHVQSLWGTIDPEWDRRNARLGTDSTAITVEAITMTALLAEHGIPYFAKLDIEGMDMEALRGFEGVSDRPKFVSLESDKDLFKGLRREIETLVALGYDSFKVVDQYNVSRQVAPNPAREGKYVDHRLDQNGSGLFGEEAPGRWMTAEETIKTYRPIFLRYLLVGDDPLLGLTARRILHRLSYRAGWYDTHARLGPRFFAD